MKTGVRPDTQALAGLWKEEYAALMREYATGGGESALGHAYELGRLALARQKSLMEIAALHHLDLKELVCTEQDEKRRAAVVQAGGDFLAECLSPYEMAHRGFQDAVTALRELNETLEEEIKRIAYAVHDEAGQLLVAVHLALAEMRPDLSVPHREQIAHIEELLQEVEAHLRRYSHELRPTVLDDLGWIPAIRFVADQVAQRASIAIDVHAAFSGRLPTATETAVYRIVQEALNNIVKHAAAKRVWIRAWREQQILYCSVRDDGIGFDPSNTPPEAGHRGLGLVAMRERASAIGGTLRIESTPGSGTQLSLRLPLEDGYVDSRCACR